jgi:hypothetical protein
LELNTKLKDFIPNTNYQETKFNTMSRNITKNGYILYAFECKEHRYKVGMCRPADLENRTNILKQVDLTGSMKSTIKLKLPHVEKLTYYLLKQHLTFIGQNTFDGSLDTIKLVFTIVSKIEDITNNTLEDTLGLLNNKIVIKEVQIEENDQQIPKVRKSTRSIDQINKDTGDIIMTYASMSAAGRILGCSGECIGISVRNGTLSQGFIWKYSGFSRDEYCKEQAVIKINCNTGERLRFDTMASAAKDANLSTPGIKNRILTDVHVKNFHWIFDK